MNRGKAETEVEKKQGPLRMISVKTSVFSAGPT
jgi:hypothetical protein